MRRLVTVAAALLATGCSTLSTMDGAKTLAPGQLQGTAGLSFQYGSNPYTYNPWNLPLPNIEIAARYGLMKDLDIGARAYLLGAGFDVRYRFYRGRKLHAAVMPGLAGAWLPTGDGTTGIGSLDMRVPITLEYDLLDWLAVSGGSRVLLLDSWTAMDTGDLGGKGSVARLDAYTGLGARFEVHNQTFSVGAGSDVYLTPARSTGLAYSIGLDATLRTPPPKRKKGR